MPEEKRSLQELEVRLKEQELRLKEIEVRAKERDIAASKWLNPVVIGLFVAATGLVGNVIVTTINSTNTQELERRRTQSTLIIEAIKTNGDTNAACKNLVFFLSLGLVEDKNRAITGACPGSVQGIPSVSVGPPDMFGGHYWFPLMVQTVDYSGAPISDARVEASLINSDTPLRIPDWVRSDNYLWSPQTSDHCTSDKEGNCYLKLAPSGSFIAILANKDGYTGNRTNTFFTGTSVVVVLQKAH